MRLKWRIALRGQDEGSTSSIGLAVAAGTLAIGFLAAHIMVSEPAGVDARTNLYDATASTALDLIVREPGLTNDQSDWALDPDRLQRFGLASDGSPNFVDYAKVRALRNATLTSNGTNNAPDYPDVLAALGITGLDVHLRTYPVLPALSDPRWTKEAHGRIAYFGHYLPVVAPAHITHSKTSDSSKMNVSVTIRNDATFDAIFSATLKLGEDDDDDDETIVTDVRHTRLLAPGESQTVWVNYYAMDWDDAERVRVTVTDPYGEVAKNLAGTTIGKFNVNGVPPEGSGAYNLFTHAAAKYYQSGETVKFVADHYDDEGDRVNNAKGRLVLFGPDGKTWVNMSINLPKTKAYEYSCANCTAVGNYTVVLWNQAVTRSHFDVVHVSAAKMFEGKSTLDPVAQTEVDLLAQIHSGFNPTRYDPLTNPAGDIFADDTNGPSDVADELTRYTTLLVGSEVSQTSLTPYETKQAIAEWVHDVGNLIVLGTQNQESYWLDPLYKASQQNANGGISAPDPTHPILVTPDRLQYDRYLDRGRAWYIAKDQPFTLVLNRGETGSSYQDTLVVSNPGSQGNGTVVLTSYMAGDLTDPQDEPEAKRFLHNLLSQSHTMLFLDYGPTIPAGVPVGSAQRLVAVPHPNVPGAIVETRIVMYVFG